jgi:hypothetical protein
MIWLLAIVVGIILGALAHQWASRRRLGELARGASAVAGFIIGYILTYIVVRHIG